jgi:hypothetical protein
MEHHPIYRSPTRRTQASRSAWRRTASLSSATVALTVSGIALGYQGFSSATASTGSAAPLAANVGAPAPVIVAPVRNGGHPDVVSALSSALIARVQAAPAAIQSVMVGPLMPYLLSQPPVADPLTLTLTVDDVALAPEENVEVTDSVLAVEGDVEVAGIQTAEPVVVARAPVVSFAVPVSDFAAAVEDAEVEVAHAAPAEAAPAFTTPAAVARPAPAEAQTVGRPRQSPSALVTVPLVVQARERPSHAQRAAPPAKDDSDQRTARSDGDKKDKKEKSGGDHRESKGHAEREDRDDD